MALPCGSARSIACAGLILCSLAGSRADAQTADRSRWEYNSGSIARSRSWIEETEKETHAFVETARNPVFVELFDPARDYTVRLYADKLLLRGGRGSAKRFVKFTRIYRGGWKGNDRRLGWEYERGSFRIDQPAAKSPTWIEKNLDGRQFFSQSKQTGDFVELSDSARDYTVRLYAGELQIRGGNTSVPARFADFTWLYAGHWVTGERRGRLAVFVDTSDAPETAKWAEAAKQLCEIWHPIIFDRLYPGSRAPARTIKMIFKGPSMKGLAFTEASQSKITISADWITKHPDDFGMVIHELTHVVQNYPRSKKSNPFWVVEGMADYVRYYDYEPEKPVPADWKKTYRDGYAIASAFLDWIQRKHNARIIEKLNARLAIGEYTDDLFADYAGAPLEQLWTQFLASERPKTTGKRR